MYLLNSMFYDSRLTSVLAAGERPRQSDLVLQPRTHIINIALRCRSVVDCRPDYSAVLESQNNWWCWFGRESQCVSHLA